MGLFSTRNSDGSSGKGESPNTVSALDWAAMKDLAVKYQNANEGGMFGEQADRHRRVHRLDRAETN